MPALISFFVALAGAVFAFLAQTTTLFYSFSWVPNNAVMFGLIVVGLVAVLFGVLAIRRGLSFWVLPAILGTLSGLGLAIVGGFLLIFALQCPQGCIGPF